MKPTSNIPRAVFLPILGFLLLLAPFKILGGLLMFGRKSSGGVPGYTGEEGALAHLDGAFAGVLLLVVTIWLLRKVWAWKPEPVRAEATTSN
jgi:membrane associated rhomboid family serine protease